MPDEEPKQELPWIKWQQGNVRVTYETVGVDIAPDDGLPPYLATRPVKGDLVDTTGGQRLEIKDIVHVLDGDKAAIKIVVGRDLGGTSEVSGGGGQGEDW